MEETKEENPISKRPSCVFTLHGNLRPKKPNSQKKYKTVGVQISPEKVEAVIQTCGRVAYDKSSQTTKISPLQVWKYPFFLSEKQLRFVAQREQSER